MYCDKMKRVSHIFIGPDPFFLFISGSKHVQGVDENDES